MKQVLICALALSAQALQEPGTEPFGAVVVKDGAIVGEIYDCTDEGQASGLPKAGEPPERSACTDASDHLPVFVDVTFR